MKDRLKQNKTIIGIILLGITALFLPIIILISKDITNLNSRASLPNNLETEQGILSSTGVSKQTDTGTSGGSYVLFNKSLATPTPGNKPTLTLNELKAFPTAYGGGASTKGGRGGVVVLVDTLDYDAPLTYVPASGGREAYYKGGIEPALEDTSIGPRYIIFDVSGTIDANLPVTYDRDDPRYTSRWGDGIFRNNPKGSGYITLYGQTAPEGGVTLYRSWIFFNQQQEFVFRHLRVRTYLLRGSGDPINDDAVTIPIDLGSRQAIVDHCTTSHGGDKGLILGSWGAGYPLQNLTAQWNMVEQSATQMFSVDGENSGAGDWDSADNVSWLYNLSMSGHRTPNIGGGYSQFNAEAQNNVLQTIASRFGNIVYGSPRVNILNNYFDVVDTSQIIQNKVQQVGSAGTDPLIYAAGNYYRTNGGVVLNGTAGEDNKKIFGDFFNSSSLPSSYFTSSNMYGQIPNPAPVLSAQEAKTQVLAKAGANRFIKNDGTRVTYRDSFDQQAVTMFNNRQSFSYDWSGFNLPSIPQNKRPSNYYQTVIGIPEWFVQKHGITDKDQVIKDWDFGDYRVINNAGYPAIEMYAAWVAHDFEELLEME